MQVKIIIFGILVDHPNTESQKHNTYLDEKLVFCQRWPS